MGNICEKSFAGLHKSPKAIAFLQDTDVPEKCPKCEWYHLCRGGCKRYREPLNINENHLCKAYQMFFATRYKHLLKLA